MRPREPGRGAEPCRAGAAARRSGRRCTLSASASTWSCSAFACCCSRLDLGALGARRSRSGCRCAHRAGRCPRALIALVAASSPAQPNATGAAQPPAPGPAGPARPEQAPPPGAVLVLAPEAHLPALPSVVPPTRDGSVWRWSPLYGAADRLGPISRRKVTGVVVPESRQRKKADYIPPTGSKKAAGSRSRAGSRRPWWSAGSSASPGSSSTTSRPNLKYMSRARQLEPGDRHGVHRRRVRALDQLGVAQAPARSA